jgi:hypothetical protein
VKKRSKTRKKRSKTLKNGAFFRYTSDPEADSGENSAKNCPIRPFSAKKRARIELF